MSSSGLERELITALRAGGRGRVTVLVDGEPVLELPREVVLAEGLREGERLGPQEQAQLLAKATRHEAGARALRFLESRERSRREVADRLRRSGFEDDTVSVTLERLQNLGYVDDRRFAGAFVRDKLRAGWGARRLRSELARKGVDRTVVEEALAEEAESSNSGGRAAASNSEDSRAKVPVGRVPGDLVALVRRKFGQELQLDPRRGERRAAAFLARRGHDWDRIEQIIRASREEESEAEVPENLFYDDA